MPYVTRFAPLILGLLLAANHLMLTASYEHHGVSAPALSPGVAMLPLPVDPEQSCALSVHYNASACGDAAYAQYQGSAEDPDQACCERAAQFFGNSSMLPSRNCYCDPDVLERLTEAEEKAYLSTPEFFDRCAKIGIVIPYYTENKQGEATGICAGYEMESADAGSHDGQDGGHGEEGKKEAQPRTFGQWFCHLNSNPFLAVCMAVAMPSVLGFLLFLWPFVFAATASLHDLARSSNMTGCPLSFGKAQ